MVTGAARGIGAATVAALGRRGWAVLAVDIVRRRPGAAVPDGHRRRPRRTWSAASPAPADRVRARSSPTCATSTRCAAAVADAEQRFGGLDAAIAAAGVIAGGVPQWELLADQERAVLDVNLGGVAQPGPSRDPGAAAPPAAPRRPVPRRRLGRRDPRPADAGRVLRREGRRDRADPRAGRRARRHRRHRERGQPRLDRDAMLAESARLYGLPARPSFAAQQPLGRLLDPAEVAAVLAFLAGPASSAMTGAVVPVDGGLAL